MDWFRCVDILNVWWKGTKNAVWGVGMQPDKYATII